MPTTVTAGSIATGQSDLAANGRVAGGSSAITVPLFVVPAGKTFFVTDVQLSTVSASEIDLQISYTLGSVTMPIYRAAITATSPCNSLGIETQPDAPGTSDVVLVLPSGISGSNIDFAISGFLQ